MTAPVVAVALWGDRGSQRLPEGSSHPVQLTVAVALWGDRGSQL